MAHGSTTHDQLTELDEICFNFWQYTLLDFYSHCRTIPIDFKVCGKIICKRKDIMHPSLLRTFGFSEISTYDSYIPLIFGKFALTWWCFQGFPFSIVGRGRTKTKCSQQWGVNADQQLMLAIAFRLRQEPKSV